MAADPITLRLDDGTDVVVLVDGEMNDSLAELLSSGDQLRLRADDLDVTGHGPANVVTVWVAGPDDVEGHALALRLPNAEAARDFQRKLIAGGAIALVVAGGAVATQAVTGDLVGGQDSQTTVSTMAVHPGATREHLRTDAPITTSAQAVHPGDSKDVLRTDAAAPVDAGAGRLDDDSPNPGK
jgi:hypothetical protein